MRVSFTVSTEKLSFGGGRVLGGEPWSHSSRPGNTTASFVCCSLSVPNSCLHVSTSFSLSPSLFLSLFISFSFTLFP